MASDRKGFVAQMLEGSEKSEDYARSTLPTNRFEAFWDILKGNLGKLCIINLLMLIFFLPMILLVITRSLVISSSGTVYPFGSNLGVGYPAFPDMTGVGEGLMMNADLLFGLGYVVAGFIAAVGLAGGGYVIRNMIWTEGVFVAHDFWKGIVKNYVNAAQATFIVTVMVLVTSYANDMASYMIAVGNGNQIWFNITKVVCYIALALTVMVAAWILALGISYKQGFWSIFKNAFIMMTGTFPQTVFFLVCAAIPYALLLIQTSFITAFVIVAVILIAFSFSLLVWLSFTQWAFDQYVNPKMGYRADRGLFKPKAEGEEEDESEAVKEYRRALLAGGRSQLASRPMEPIDDGVELYELPESFSREDIARRTAERRAMIRNADDYAEAHKNEARYAEYNRMWDEREKALRPETDKKGRSKKKKLPNLVKK